MKLLEDDVALVAILTLLLFSLVKFEDALGSNSTAAVASRTGTVTEQLP